MNAQTTKTLEQHDVSDLIGLRVVILDAAVETIDADGEVCVDVPNLEAAAAAAAVARCLLPIRLRGPEIRAIRKIAGMTALEMAERMDTKASAETLSRWENDKQPMGGYAEKVFRLVICDRLQKDAPGIQYTDGAIAKLILIDPWRADQSYEVPAIYLECFRMKSSVGREMINAWGTELSMAA